jgi:hypothetical protein
MLSKAINKTILTQSARAFGAMDKLNPDLFHHTFTNKMEFKSKFDKFQCFRVMDGEGNIVTPGYDN